MRSKRWPLPIAAQQRSYFYSFYHEESTKAGDRHITGGGDGAASAQDTPKRTLEGSGPSEQPLPTRKSGQSSELASSLPGVLVVPPGASDSKLVPFPKATCALPATTPTPSFHPESSLRPSSSCPFCLTED